MVWRAGGNGPVQGADYQLPCRLTPPTLDLEIGIPRGRALQRPVVTKGSCAVTCGSQLTCIGVLQVDFSQCRQTEEDEMWQDQKEDNEKCMQRGLRFLQWLMKRPESRIAVVTHSVHRSPAIF
jgi:hypothetical protein